MAESALEWFLIGYGFVLPKGVLEPGSYNDNDRKAAENEFSQRFKKQIKHLIQREPRMYKDKNGDFVIAYD